MVRFVCASSDEKAFGVDGYGAKASAILMQVHQTYVFCLSLSDHVTCIINVARFEARISVTRKLRRSVAVTEGERLLSRPTHLNMLINHYFVIRFAEQELCKFAQWFYYARIIEGDVGETHNNIIIYKILMSSPLRAQDGNYII